MSDVKLCECGCGQPAPLATQTDRRYGCIKEQPHRFILGHKLSLTVRFWAKVDQSGGPDACWPWVGHRTSDGYGKIYDNAINGPRYATHVAWELAHGPIPAGLHLLHRCDNPPCVHAECEVPGCQHLQDSVECKSHFFLGTQADNNRDMASKDRNIHGSRCHNAKLTEAQVALIHARLTAGEGVRALAREYGLSSAQISRIHTGKRWARVPR